MALDWQACAREAAEAEQRAAQEAAKVGRIYIPLPIVPLVPAPGMKYCGVLCAWCSQKITHEFGLLKSYITLSLRSVELRGRATVSEAGLKAGDIIDVSFRTV